jgi:hypothetical protein
VDAGIDWALKKFGADPARVSVGGRGYWGGTAALQYGLKRPGEIAYVLSGSNPDPDPGQTPETFKMYLWRDGERPRPTPIGQIEAVWGKREWDLKTEDGTSIWKVANLVDYVKDANGPLPYMTLGAGSMSFTWKQQTGLMQAFRTSRNAFMAQFYRGGSDFVGSGSTGHSRTWTASESRRSRCGTRTSLRTRRHRSMCSSTSQESIAEGAESSMLIRWFSVRDTRFRAIPDASIAGRSSFASTRDGEPVSIPGCAASSIA